MLVNSIISTWPGALGQILQVWLIRLCAGAFSEMHTTTVTIPTVSPRERYLMETSSIRRAMDLVADHRQLRYKEATHMGHIRIMLSSLTLRKQLASTTITIPTLLSILTIRRTTHSSIIPLSFQGSTLTARMRQAIVSRSSELAMTIL